MKQPILNDIYKKMEQIADAYGWQDASFGPGSSTEWWAPGFHLEWKTTAGEHREERFSTVHAANAYLDDKLALARRLKR